MVGQHAEEDVRLHAPLFVGKDRPLPQGRLEGPKRCFGPRQQSVDPPSLIRAQILAVVLQQVTPIELFRALPAWPHPSCSGTPSSGCRTPYGNTARRANIAPSAGRWTPPLLPAWCLCLCPWPHVFAASPSPPAVASRGLRES